MNANIVENNENKNKGVKLYASGGCVIIKSVWNTEKFSTNNCTRSAISGFSVKSAQRMRRYLRGCEAVYDTMLTLTYPFSYESDGVKVKLHLKKFMRWLKGVYISMGLNHKGGFSAFWFLEFQERGAPHFHIFSNVQPRFKEVARKWYEIVDSEDERHLVAGTRTETLKKGRGGTISYASKYAAKACQKSVPADYKNVGRFWGVYGNRVVVEADTVVKSVDYKKYESNFKKIRKYLDLAKVDSRTVEYVNKNGCEVWFIHNVSCFSAIKREISIIEAKVNHYSHLFDCADVEP